MSGIKREISPDPRASLIDRHLPNTPQVQRLLRREGKAHVFNDRWTLERVTIIRTDGSTKSLYYGEIKIVKSTGEYHVIPRTGPRRTS